MKTKLSLFSAACLLFLPVAPASASADFVTLHVEVKSEQHDVPPHENRLKWLVVRVTNESPESLEGAVLRWKLFRETLEFGPNHIALEKSGEEKLALPGKGQTTDVTTPKVDFKWTLPHSVRSGRRSFKRIPESGIRYHGYIVEVVKDGKVIAEALSNESLKKYEKAKEEPTPEKSTSSHSKSSSE